MLDLHERTEVSVEATAFLGFSVALVFLFLVFLLYFNNKKCSNFNACCDEVFTGAIPSAQLVRKIAASNQNLGSEKSEVEENALKRLQMKIQNVQESKYNSQSSQVHINMQTNTNSDLISLAEKGRVGRGSSSSSSGSMTSGEEEHALRHRDPKCTTRVLNKPIEEDENHCVVTLSQEPLYSVSPEQSRSVTFESDDLTESTDSSGTGCGYLEVAFAYDAPMKKMTIHVLQARGTSLADRGAYTHSQVRFLLLPSKKQKHKSKIRSGENPLFIESFVFNRIIPEEVNGMGVRVRLYGCSRMRRVRLIGETIISFASINLELENNIWLTLEPKVSSSVALLNGEIASLSCSESMTGSTASMQHGGVAELLVGLTYNPTTGRLAVEIIKGSHFRIPGLNRAPDTYVKIWLVSGSGLEMSHSKTSVRKGQPNPLFKQTFMFQVALFQLADVTLMIAVYAKRAMKKKDMIGWFSMGQNSSGEEELSHWDDMRQVHGVQIARWHVLLDT